MADYNIDSVLGRLDAKCSDLDAAFEIVWHYPAQTPDNALNAKTQDDWLMWDNSKHPALRKNEENWFYADLVFPESKCGISQQDTVARFFINSWSPFTLWVDGVEVFKEEHTWYATGPIADPFPVLIQPGKSYRLVANFIPTELPADLNAPAGIQVHSEVCQDMAIQVSAAALQLRVAQGFAKNDAEKQIIVKAAEAINLNALENNKWDELTASFTAMEDILMPFSARAKNMTVHCVGHTHIDMDWMWTWPDTVHCIRRDAKAITDMMDDYQDLTFTVSQVPFYDVVRQDDPDVFEKIKKYNKAGRWECVAGTWVEGDLNMADGEDIARHMLYAKKWTRENMGMEANVFWAPDTFGHPGNMPQLVKHGELDIYFHWRCNPDLENGWPVRSWVGVDGTPVMALSECYGSNLSPNAVKNNITNFQNHGYDNVLHIWGLGDHGGGLPRHSMKSLNAYRDKPVIPNFKYDTINNTLKSIMAENKQIKSNKGETYSLFEGCFTTHASVKRYNRYCETALLTAEAASALAEINQNDKLRVGWQKMLFNHFHDIFDGAAVHDSYINAHQRGDEAISASNEVIQDSLNALKTMDNNGDVVTLLNPLGFPRTEPVTVELPAGSVAVKDAAGKIIPVQPLDDKFVFIATNVPALSIKSYQVLAALPADVKFAAISVTDAVGNNFKIETNTATSQLHKESGVIGSYYDKKLAVEYVAYGIDKSLTHVPCTRRDLALNVFQIIDEAHNNMTAWLINDIMKEENLLRGAEVALVESGPVFARFNVKHKVRSSTICEDVIYYNDFPRVDFIANIDWREQGNPTVGVPHLKVSFGSTVKAARARFEGPFFLPERRADGTEQVTQKFLDISGEEFGYTIFNDSKYGVDALGGRARLSLLRNPYNPDPEPDNGNHLIKFAFAPHGADIPSSELVRQGMAYNRPNIAVQSELSLASKPNIVIEGTDAIVCTSVRNAEYSDKIAVRFFNASDADVKATISIGAEITTAEEVNFLERATGNAVVLKNGKISADFHPYEVKTLLVSTQWIKNII